MKADMVSIKGGDDVTPGCFPGRLFHAKLDAKIQFAHDESGMAENPRMPCITAGRVG